MLTGKDTAVVEKYRQQAVDRLGAYEDALETLTAQLAFNVNIIPPCVKDEISCLRKVWDRNAKSAYGQPENIIDYLRATIIVPEGPNGIKSLRDTINMLIAHPMTVAYKDQFWKPDEETGYRSLKALLNIDGHTAELKVDYEGMKDANEMTESMRKFERTLKEAEVKAPMVCGDRTDSFGNSLRKMTNKMEGMIGKIRELRMECHDYYAAGCGLNELLDPAAKREHSLTVDFAKSVKDAIRSGNPFGRGLQSMLGMLEGGKPANRLH